MKKIQKDIIVIGSGPGGYAAAFYLADHGKDVLLIEKEDVGGVCLNRGVFHQALLNVAALLDKTDSSSKKGIHFGKPKIDVNELRDWKNSVVGKLKQGIEALAKARKVEIVKGRAVFDDSSTIRVEAESGQQFYTFNQAIIASGSRPFIPAAMDLGKS